MCLSRLRSTQRFTEYDCCGICGPAQLRDRSHSGGGSMKKVGVFASMIFGFAGAAYATDAPADDSVGTRATAGATRQAPATCGSLEDFVVTSCPLTSLGAAGSNVIARLLRLIAHGAPFNGTSAPG